MGLANSQMGLANSQIGLANSQMGLVNSQIVLANSQMGFGLELELGSDSKFVKERGYKY